MPSRREFIQAGLAASIAPVAIPIRASSGITPLSVTPPHHSLYGVVCDMRFPWSADLARQAEHLGARVVHTSGDITDFWFDDLSQRWKESSVAIGGLTAHGPLFCLERLGWDHGLRVVFRGTHRLLAAGHLEHALSGPSDTVASISHAGLAGADWPRHVARLLNSCAIGGHTASMTVKGFMRSDHDVAVHDTLVSWVIAPKYA